MTTVTVEEQTIDVTVVEDVITLNVSGGASPNSVAAVASDLSDHESLSTTAHGGIVADSDSRLTDARTPTAHASTHATGEDDPIAAADIGAEPTITGGTSTQVWNGLKSFVAGVWLDVAQTWTAVQTFTAGIVTGVIKPAADATNAIQIQDAGGTAVLTFDTTNNRIEVFGTANGQASVITSHQGYYCSRSSSGYALRLFGLDTSNNFIFGDTLGVNSQTKFFGNNKNMMTIFSDGLISLGHWTTATAAVDITASTTAAASLRLRDGVAPTTPNNGDIWQDGTDLLIRIGGTTYKLDKTAA